MGLSTEVVSTRRHAIAWRLGGAASCLTHAGSCGLAGWFDTWAQHRPAPRVAGSIADGPGGHRTSGQYLWCARVASRHCNSCRYVPTVDAFVFGRGGKRSGFAGAHLGNVCRPRGTSQGCCGGVWRGRFHCTRELHRHQRGGWSVGIGRGLGYRVGADLWFGSVWLGP